MTKVPFKAEELKVGDIITMPRLDRKEEAQRWLIVDSDRSLLRVIVLLDSGNRYGWLRANILKSQAKNAEYRKGIYERMKANGVGVGAIISTEPPDWIQEQLDEDTPF